MGKVSNFKMTRFHELLERWNPYFNRLRAFAWILVKFTHFKITRKRDLKLDTFAAPLKYQDRAVAAARSTYPPFCMSS